VFADITVNVCLLMLGNGQKQLVAKSINKYLTVLPLLAVKSRKKQLLCPPWEGQAQALSKGGREGMGEQCHNQGCASLPAQARRLPAESPARGAGSWEVAFWAL